ncbi:MAG TPA: RDD family protein [Marinobacterium sp.]|nr:RDD family protein [Marinobacterium sp.]
MPTDFTADLSQVTPATLTRRVLAMIYDTLLVVAISMVVVLIAVALNGGEAIDTPLGEAALRSALLCTNFLFFAVCWTRAGQTLGMLAWHLRVQNHDGTKLRWTQALIRFFGGAFSLLCFGLGFWMILLSDERLAWHDRWSNSVVVRIPKPKRPRA